MKLKSVPFRLFITLAAIGFYAESQAALVNVCERTPAVTKFLELTLKKPCADITLDDLATVKRVAVPGKGIKNFAEGDFANLPNLEILNITRNPVEALTPGMFAGLTKLKTFVLFRAGLKSIPEDFLEGMDDIENLHIFGNLYTDLPESVMERLSRLKHAKNLDLSRTLNAEDQARLKEMFPAKSGVQLAFL